MLKKQAKKNANEMSFLEHLEALRWLIVKVLAAVIVGAVFVFIYIKSVFEYIIFAPLKSDFLTYRALCKATNWLHTQLPNVMDADTGCLDEIAVTVISPQMTTEFMSAMLVSFIGGIILMFPFIIYQFWLFLKPALYKKEEKNARGLVFWTSLLFTAGILFGYYLIAPLSINFLGNFSVSSTVVKMPSINSFMGILASTTLASGVVFELPIVVYFLSRVGLVSPEGMKKYRKHSFVGTLLLSAIITPPDVFSQILVSIPIIILYEISIFISRFVHRKRDNDDY